MTEKFAWAAGDLEVVDADLEEKSDADFRAEYPMPIDPTEILELLKDDEDDETEDKSGTVQGAKLGWTHRAHGKLQEVPKGKYLGTGKPAECDTNATAYVASHPGAELYVGHMSWRESGTGKKDSARHAWVVENGKVVEPTPLQLEGKNDWRDNYHYHGVRVPDNIRKKNRFGFVNWFYDEVDKSTSAADRLSEVLKATHAQIEAGNYKMKHVKFQDLDISLESEKGSTRRGISKKTGKPWSNHMYYDYGYIRRTEGVDGDHVDVYLGPDETAQYVYVVHQLKPDTGEYDEDKCMLGFSSEEAAKTAYLKQYDSPKFFGAITAVPLSLFKERVFEKKGEQIVPDGSERATKKSLFGHPFFGNQWTTGQATPASKDFYTRYHGWWSSLPEDESRQVTAYVKTQVYHKINSALRGHYHDPQFDASLPDMLKRLDSALAKAPPTDKPMTVYRGLQGAPLEAFKNAETVTDAAYVSTTTFEPLAREWVKKTGGVVAVIDVPAGTHGAYLESNTEAEFLMPRNRKFKVKGVDAKNSTVYLEAL